MFAVELSGGDALVGGPATSDLLTAAFGFDVEFDGMEEFGVSGGIVGCTGAGTVA
jgi:hypothetical protein